MRRDFVAKRSLILGVVGLGQLIQLPDLRLKKVDLLLLAERRTVQHLDAVLAVAQLDFQLNDFGVHEASFGAQIQRAPQRRPLDPARL